MHVHVWTHAIEHTSKRDERINGPQDEGWRALYTIRQMNAWVWLYISWPGKHDHTHLRKHVSGLGFVRSRSGRWVALCTYPLKMWVIVIGPDRRQASHCLMTCWIFWRNLAVFFPDWSSGFTCCRSTKKKETQIYWIQNGPCPWFCTRIKTLIGWQKLQGINILEQEFSSVFWAFFQRW